MIHFSLAGYSNSGPTSIHIHTSVRSQFYFIYIVYNDFNELNMQNGVMSNLSSDKTRTTPDPKKYNNFWGRFRWTDETKADLSRKEWSCYIWYKTDIVKVWLPPCLPVNSCRPFPVLLYHRCLSRFKPQRFSCSLVRVSSYVRRSMSSP